MTRGIVGSLLHYPSSLPYINLASFQFSTVLHILWYSISSSLPLLFFIIIFTAWISGPVFSPLLA